MKHRQFIWIMTDTTGWNMIGCYGFEGVKTPNIDSMAEQGVRFERAYTCQPVCGPARSALFTGMYPHSNGSWGNCMPLGANVRTLGQWLSAQGISCAYIGKWHLDGGDYFGEGVCPDGWDSDYWYDMSNYLDELTGEERYLSRQSSTCRAPNEIKAEFTYADRVTRRALDYIEKHRDEDFLLVVSYDEPHDPCLCPPPYNTMYDGYHAPRRASLYDTLEGKPEYQKIWAGGKQLRDRSNVSPDNPLLMGCNSFVDSEIGRVLKAASELAPDAMRMFTSDHGDAMEAHCLSAKGPAIYDEIARIPLIFNGPQAGKGVVYPHTVSHIDLAATVMDYFGQRRPKCFEGESLMPQVGGSLEPTGRPAFVEFNRYEQDHDGFGGFQPMRAAVEDRYKLALHLTDTDEFYDEADDECDMINRIDDEEYAAERNRLHDLVLDWMNRTRDPFRGYQWKCRPWRPEYKPTWDVDGLTRQRENEPGERRQLDYCTGLEMGEATRPKGILQPNPFRKDEDR